MIGTVGPGGSMLTRRCWRGCSKSSWDGPGCWTDVGRGWRSEEPPVTHSCRHSGPGTRTQPAPLPSPIAFLCPRDATRQGQLLASQKPLEVQGREVQQPMALLCPCPGAQSLGVRCFLELCSGKGISLPRTMATVTGLMTHPKSLLRASSSPHCSHSSCFCPFYRQRNQGPEG